MALKVNHAKVSGLTNPVDPAVVGGEDWDDDHALLPAVGAPDGYLLGNSAGGLVWVDPASLGGGPGGSIISADETLLIGPGQTYATVAAALAYLDDKRISGSAVVSLQLPDGDTTENVTINHPDSTRIRFTSTTAPITTVRFNACSTVASAGNDRTYELTCQSGYSTAALQVGDNFALRATTATTAPIGGCWKVTSIVDADRIQIAAKQYGTGADPSFTGSLMIPTFTRSNLVGTLTVARGNTLGSFTTPAFSGVTMDGSIRLNGAALFAGSLTMRDPSLTGGILLRYGSRAYLGSAISSALLDIREGSSVDADSAIFSGIPVGFGAAAKLAGGSNLSASNGKFVNSGVGLSCTGGSRAWVGSVPLFSYNTTDSSPTLGTQSADFSHVVQ